MKHTKMSIVLPHSKEFSFQGVSVDTYFTFRLTTTGTCGFSRKTSNHRWRYRKQPKKFRSHSSGPKWTSANLI